MVEELTKEGIAYNTFVGSIEKRKYDKAFETFAETPDLVSYMPYNDAIRYHDAIKKNIGKIEAKIFRNCIDGLFAKNLLIARGEDVFPKVLENIQRIQNEMRSNKRI